MALKEPPELTSNTKMFVGKRSGNQLQTLQKVSVTGAGTVAVETQCSSEGLAEGERGPRRGLRTRGTPHFWAARRCRCTQSSLLVLGPSLARVRDAQSEALRGTCSAQGHKAETTGADTGPATPYGTRRSCLLPGPGAAAAPSPPSASQGPRALHGRSWHHGPDSEPQPPSHSTSGRRRALPTAPPPLCRPP